MQLQEMLVVSNFFLDNIVLEEIETQQRNLKKKREKP